MKLFLALTMTLISSLVLASPESTEDQIRVALDEYNSVSQSADPAVAALFPYASHWEKYPDDIQADAAVYFEVNGQKKSCNLYLNAQPIAYKTSTDSELLSIVCSDVNYYLLQDKTGKKFAAFGF